MARRTTAGKRRGEQAELRFESVQDVTLHETARRRYLNYAMSVITARALPDVRDGLKPVQRRILYTMHHELHLLPAAKPLKCARIVGDVLGKFHPHGDVAVYEALVRMAQDFSLRYPLIDGHGNFGSLDGDGAAAYRYTEARLRPMAIELLLELPRETVEFRPNYDGRTEEPCVLPARVPNLLINGASGIAVGMATNIPPHNLAEVLVACEALIEKRGLAVPELMEYVKGPDFPTGGQVLNTRAELIQIYQEGQGTIRLRGEYKTEGHDRGSQRVVITSIPYMVQKDTLVRAIGDLIVARKVPQLVDVRDESTADVRIVLEMKRDADPDAVLAYLFKHTPLQTNFNVNLTCLVPAASGAPGALPVPARLDLASLLLHFIDFRFEVVKRRFEHDLRVLVERIHILEGFAKLFDALDEAIRMIRGSEGRADAAARLQQRFGLDDRQTDAILDLRLYRLARLEIRAVLEELADKRRQAAEIEKILASPRRLWAGVRQELAELRAQHADGRRTRIGGRPVQEMEYAEEDFIVDEDNYVLLSRDGWVRRVGQITDLSKVRMRQGDELLAVLAGNTKSCVVFFSNLGSAYTVRINDLPASRGYGEPIQGLFKFRDGERVVGALSFDPRFIGAIGSATDPEGTVPESHLLVIGSGGYGLRCALFPFAEPSTRSGRKLARLKEGEEIVGIHLVTGTDETVILATQLGRAILFACGEINFLSGPGRGVLAIKLAAGDRVLGSRVSRGARDGLRAVTTRGGTLIVTPQSYRVTSRGGRGVEIIKRGGLTALEAPELALPAFKD